MSGIAIPRAVTVLTRMRWGGERRVMAIMDHGAADHTANHSRRSRRRHVPGKLCSPAYGRRFQRARLGQLPLAGHGNVHPRACPEVLRWYLSLNLLELGGVKAGIPLRDDVTVEVVRDDNDQAAIRASF